jgi:hypothetical protein
MKKKCHSNDLNNEKKKCICSLYLLIIIIISYKISFFPVLANDMPYKKFLSEYFHYFSVAFVKIP